MIGREAAVVAATLGGNQSPKVSAHRQPRGSEWLFGQVQLVFSLDWMGLDNAL
jgi:hypothetical protein